MAIIMVITDIVVIIITDIITITYTYYYHICQGGYVFGSDS